MMAKDSIRFTVASVLGGFSNIDEFSQMMWLVSKRETTLLPETFI